MACLGKGAAHTWMVYGLLGRSGLKHWAEEATACMLVGKAGNNGSQQVNLSLWRGDTTLEAMYARLTTHSVVVQSSVSMLTKAGKPDSHESPFKYKIELVYGFIMTVGYSRFRDGAIGKGWAHAWAAFGATRNTRLRKEMAIDVLLELTGHRPRVCHHHAKTTTL